MARQLHAMIVDDSAMTRKMVMRSLEQAGLAEFSFTEAENGQDALEKFQPDATDLMFVDMKMPKMDGPEFLQTLRRTHANCPPAVMVTAEAKQEIVKEAIAKADVDAFLLKPIDTERLLKGLRPIIQSIPERTGPWTVPHGDVAALAVEKMLRDAAGVTVEADAAGAGIEEGDVVFANISLMGQVFWQMVLGFSGKAACGIASKFAGMEIAFESPDLGDAIGELANMVAGQVKRELADRGIDCEISLPTVMAAREFRLLGQGKRRTTEDVAHYTCEFGRFWIGVAAGITSGLIL